MEIISADRINTFLEKNQGWKQNGDFIEKSFQFKDFKAAFSFMTSVAFEAEAINHHPDWYNVYNQVHIKLSTHDAGGLTEKDLSLAARIDDIFQ